ncbi:MAG: ABC transporter substrate-binding protein, partial [Granulosicoccaceae bacterium]
MTTHTTFAGRLIAVLLFFSCAVAFAAQTHTLGADKRADTQTLKVYSTTDFAVFEAVLQRYLSSRPALRIEYLEMDSLDLYQRVRREHNGSDGADLVLSAAMDLQIKLANDGYARPYQSSLTAQLPRWANWRNEAFGVTFEAAVTVYNERLLPEASQPRNRRALAQWLRQEPERFYGKIISYDPERSGVGFLLATQDAKRSSSLWELTGSFGHNKIKLF